MLVIVFLLFTEKPAIYMFLRRTSYPLTAPISKWQPFLEVFPLNDIDHRTNAKTLGLVRLLGQHQLQGRIETDRTGGTLLRLRFGLRQRKR